ncbi:MAG: GTPase ObgE [Proteobacteria bacterium]|nr:GTPase ObgE [Pseudomonadota bacterium]
MKFVDEAVIKVSAGKGGDGSASFRREKYVPRGGPDGGDGGRGGSVYLLATTALNTLIDFRYQTQFSAQNGEAGAKRECSGRHGEDCVISVPVGTIVRDLHTQEILGDLVTPGIKLLVAKGGRRGLGNVNFKSSTNRAPRHTTQGGPGEFRELQLELKLLAEVGLLGLPNAGKSTFISAISSARPKVADYPFTTLYPHLGIVALSNQRRFIVADIPGVVRGAGQGKGLGLQFLKHLSRTSLLLHIVDLLPMDGSDPAQNILTIEEELAAFNKTLLNKPRWLVFNKIDCFTKEEAQLRIQEILKSLGRQEHYFAISALAKTGTLHLCEAIMAYLQQRQEEVLSAVESLSG